MSSPELYGREVDMLRGVAKILGVSTAIWGYGPNYYIRVAMKYPIINMRVDIANSVLVFFAEHIAQQELVTIELAEPRSLVRARLREAIVEAKRKYRAINEIRKMEKTRKGYCGY